ncbi:MAG: restriction endonuclease subunit S, partial [Candidatus Electrothrix sp. AX5]|nr:restriction endonuclease subunit S [Candidatus Electrothrix sp. AX5]
MKVKEENVPVLRFPGFSGEWSKEVLGKVFRIFNGYAFSSTDAKDNGALWVKIADVGICKMKTDNLSFLPVEYLSKYKKFVLHKGDFVVALTRPILNGKLKISRIDNNFNNSLLNQRVGKLISDNDLEFIFSMLQKPRLISYIENSIAGTDPPNFAPSSIKNIRVYVPQVAEQQKIASFLTAVNSKIEQLSKKKALLEQYKKGMMQKLFSQEIRF